MKKKIFFILLIVLSIVSFLSILICGDTFTATIYNEQIKEDSKIDVEIENKKIIKYTNIDVKNKYIKVKLKAKSKGKTYLNVSNNDEEIYTTLIYVHRFNIISYSNYFGDTTGARAIPISTTILLTYILINVILLYIKGIKKNMYQYKNILYLGLIIFLCFITLNQSYYAFLVPNYKGLYQTLYQFITIYSNFSIILLPIAIITSILVIISNIVLVTKEGFSIKRLLGLILGTFLCFMTIFPQILYYLLNNVTWINIHNENGLGMYIYLFIELGIYTIISYLECILLGTIILSIKAAKHKPKYNKDYIIILGCKIKNDGTLPPLLKGRVDRAIEFSKLQKENSNKDIIFVPSGGKGNDEIISEGEAIKNYLIEQDINKNKILLEDKSKNTYQNIKYSYKLINNKDANIAFSTTNYHVFRAGNIACNQKINIEGIGSKTKSYFWINAFIREFIATLVSERKTNIKIVLLIIANTTIMIILMYLANIL